MILRRSKDTRPRRFKSKSDLTAYMIEQSHNVSQSILSFKIGVTSRHSTSSQIQKLKSKALERKIVELMEG